jgi:hypothetical protein
MSLSASTSSEDSKFCSSVRSALSKLGINYEEAGRNSGVFRFERDIGKMAIIAKNHLIVYVLYDDISLVKDSIRRNLAHFICRINMMLNYGNFEFNFDECKVRYKLSFPVMEVEDATGILGKVFTLADQTFSKYLKGLNMICKDRANAEQALAACRKLSITSLSSSFTT